MTQWTPLNFSYIYFFWLSSALVAGVGYSEGYHSTVEI